MNRSAAVLLATGIIVFVGITITKRGRGGSEPSPAAARDSSPERERVLRFWDRYRDATRHRTAGRIQEAAAAYAEALALDGRHEDALYYSGSMRFELGEFAEAEAAWRRLIEVNEAGARAHSRLGDLYLCYERPEWFDLPAAEAQFRRAAEINPEETGPLLRLGESALVRGDLVSARARLDEVLSTNSGSIEARFLRGYVAWKDGESADADARTTGLVELLRTEEAEEMGLNEGDTETGGAMVATTNRCQGVRDIVESLVRGAAPVTRGYIDTLYRRADTLLAAVQGKMR